MGSPDVSGLPPQSKDMSPARTLHILKQEEFDRLLTWLDHDAERAGLTYEKIRWRLVAILASRGCVCPEELADETIDRVARRVVDIQDSYVGDKAIYFLGVMNNVHHEYLKRPMTPRPPEPDDDVEAKENGRSSCWGVQTTEDNHDEKTFCGINSGADNRGL